MVDGRGDRTPSWDLSKGCLDPLVDIEETEDEVIVTADLPCVHEEDIEVRVKEKELTIKAQMKREMRFESWGGAHRKVSFNSFSKNLLLPHRVNPEGAEANFKNGILEVELPKKVSEEKKRSIDIK